MTGDAVTDAFNKIGGEEEAEEVRERLNARIAEYFEINGRIVLNKRPFIVRDTVIMETIYTKGVLKSIGIADVLMNHQYVCPVLTLTLHRHEELGTAGCIDNGCEETYFIITFGIDKGLT